VIGLIALYVSHLLAQQHARNPWRVFFVINDERLPTMREDIRHTGIDVIDQVPWGTHLCLFYETKEDLRDTLVPYFRAGLESNECCMWVTSAPLTAEDARKSLKRVVQNLDACAERGQLEILDHSQWYTRSGAFGADRVLQGWLEKENLATESGFDGLRVAGNTTWLEKEHWREFADYESAINGILPNSRMIAVCAYSLDKCAASEVLDVLSSHQFALTRRQGKWVELERLKKLVRVIMTTRPDEIACDECLDRLDRFVETRLAGTEVPEAMRLLQDHLERCDDCREEFEALLAAARAPL
jgi:hypothetical protein